MSIKIKFLISDEKARIVIGRAGLQIKNLQQDTGAKIVLSNPGSFFPCTEEERTVLVSGIYDQVEVCLQAIINLAEGGSETPVLHMVLPAESVDLMLSTGRKGSCPL